MTVSGAAPAAPGDATAAGGRDRVRDALAVLAVLAVATASWFGWSWWHTAHDEDLQFASARDAVLDAGRQELIVLNTLDYQDADHGLERWRQAATGALLDELTRSRDSDAQQIRTAKTATAAKVVEAAVTRLDTHAGTADVIAVLEVSVTANGGQPSIRRSRLDAGMARTPQGWKVASLQVVGVVG
ncbi:hypothetical protein [Gandjariella thermophila]|uniref:Mce-associated membrane protein n=1 Tax=Gandjariella thermophila TaxID=1931992 RepID=A0A4D4IY26_9PSEU|nr:hypothetical protein [Gandjariella thermophila]GDY29131.1 hypothetical protein GTS_07640 [Gandjariella thermophila]